MLMNMKTAKGSELILSIFMLFTFVGCNSTVPATDPPITTSATVVETAPKPEIAIGYDWRGNWSYDDQRIVEMEQGALAGDDLAVCHSSLVADGKISNRLADQCDRIASRGLAIQKRRQADERRKDEAYDKAHAKAHE